MPTHRSVSRARRTRTTRVRKRTTTNRKMKPTMGIYYHLRAVTVAPVGTSVNNHGNPHFRWQCSFDLLITRTAFERSAWAQCQHTLRGMPVPTRPHSHLAGLPERCSGRSPHSLLRTQTPGVHAGARGLSAATVPTMKNNKGVKSTNEDGLEPPRPQSGRHRRPKAEHRWCFYQQATRSRPGIHQGGERGRAGKWDTTTPVWKWRKTTVLVLYARTSRAHGARQIPATLALFPMAELDIVIRCLKLLKAGRNQVGTKSQRTNHCSLRGRAEGCPHATGLFGYGPTVGNETGRPWASGADHLLIVFRGELAWDSLGERRHVREK